MNLSRVIFWETDYDKIDWKNKAQYVIERVVVYGNMEDWRSIQKYYGMEKIKEAALRSRVLDPKTLNFLSKIFDIPQTVFRSHEIIQSNPGHWVY